VSLPLRQLGACHWLEKLRPYTQHALERSELTLGPQRVDGREPCYWNLAAGNDDLLTGLNSGEKLGKIGLRGVYGDDGHQRSKLSPHIS
jgi:hypothetical protein